MSFNYSYFRNIDLDRACKDQYGTLAKAYLKYNHVWGWSCSYNGKDYSIDLNQAAKRQIGDMYRSYMTSLKTSGWKFMSLRSFRHKVVPVILVGNEDIWNVDGVEQKIENYKSHLSASQEWIRQLVGKTFDCIPPILIYCNIEQTKLDEWNEIMKHEGQNKYDYFYGLRDYVKNALGDDFNDENIYLISHSGQNNGSSALYPFALIHSELLDNKWSIFSSIEYKKRGDVADNIYALTHEFLHTLGLNHCPENNGIMLFGRPPYGSLNEDELAHLRKSKFLT